MKTVETLETPFKHLVMTIGELPTTFVESMSYYETIAWLCDYIAKNVIPAVNTNAEAIKEIQAWILNLDLQDEVDNKLDEMAEDGSLAEIIAAYLTIRSVQAYDTISDMKASQNMIDGSIARTLGGSNYQDGDGHFYRIRTLLESDTIDEDNLIALTNAPTLVAEKIPDAAIDSLITELSGKTNLDELHQIRLQGNGATYGMYEDGAAFAFQANVGSRRTGVMGLDSSTEAANYSNRDSVAAYIYGRGNNPVLDYSASDATYTATTITCPSLTAEQIEMIEGLTLTNCIYDSYKVNGQSFVRYTALITDFDGDTKTFTISGGFHGVNDSDTSETYTPASGTNFYIGLCTKVWGANILANISADVPLCKSASAIEAMVTNYQTNIANDVTVVDAIGKANAEGAAKIVYGYRARGDVQTAYDAIPTYQAFHAVLPNDTSKILLRQEDELGNNVFLINGGGQMSSINATFQEIGANSVQMLNRSLFHITMNLNSGYAYFLSPYGKPGRIIFISYDGTTQTISYDSNGTTKNLTINNGSNAFFSDGNTWIRIV